MVDVWWTTLSLAVAAVCLLYTWSTRNHDHWDRRGVAFIQPVPFFGNMLPMLLRCSSVAEIFQKHYHELKPHRLAGMFEFNTPTLMVTDPELLRDITVKYFDHFTDRRVINIGLETDPLFSRALSNLHGAEWREMRGLLSPAFTSSKLRTMFPLLRRCSERFATFLLSRPHAQTSPLEFKSSFSRLTNDMIASVAFGVECDATKNPKEEFYRNVEKMLNYSGTGMMKLLGYMLAPRLMQWLGLSFVSREVMAYFQQLVKSTMDYRDSNQVSRPDMLQLLMQAQRGGIQQDDEQHAATLTEQELLTYNTKRLISDEDIAAQAGMLLFAGYETVSTLLSFLAHELAENPHVQRQLRDEVDAAILENNGELTYDVVLDLKYLDMVVSEALRKYPPAAFADRTCVQSFREASTHVIIEKGTFVQLPIFPLHRDPEYFPHPEQFQPERFSEENKKNIKPYTYLPFGSGPRNCIGMRLALLEAKLVTCYLLATCELKVSAKTQIPLELSKKTFLMTTDEGFWLIAAPRETPSIQLSQNGLEA